jgi:hypothetical protein
VQNALREFPRVRVDSPHSSELLDEGSRFPYLIGVAPSVPCHEANNLHAIEVAKAAVLRSDLVERVSTIVDQSYASVARFGECRQSLLKLLISAYGDDRFRCRHFGRAIGHHPEQPIFVVRAGAVGCRGSDGNPSLKALFHSHDVFNALQDGPSVRSGFQASCRFVKTIDGIEKILPSGFESVYQIHPKILHVRGQISSRRRRGP